MNASHLTGFRKAHMRAFCYSIRDMNYRQMRASRNSVSIEIGKQEREHSSAQKVQVK